jgi:Tol biopolymer transport system component
VLKLASTSRVGCINSVATPDVLICRRIEFVHPTRITGNSARPADWARWSPNGDRIIFATQRTAPTGAIWTVRPDGSHLQKIFSGSGNRFPIQPIWSPDGTQILFALDPSNDQFTHPANALYLARPDGTHLQLLIGGANFKSQPEWWH